MQILLQYLQSFLDELPRHMDEIREVRLRLAVTAELLEGGKGATFTEVADEFGDWLMGYFQFVSFLQPLQADVLNAGPREQLINLEDLRLWEIWYTGSTPFPSEVRPFPTSPLGYHDLSTDTAGADAQPCSSRQHRFRASSAAEFPFGIS